MNSKTYFHVTTLALLTAFFQPLLPAGTPPRTSVSEQYGEVHAGGKYSIPTRTPPCDYLNEGVDRIEQLGSRVVKLWLTRNFRTTYPDFSQSNPWPVSGITTLKQILMTSQYRAVLDRPGIKTYVFVTGDMPVVDWKNGLQASEKTSVKSGLSDAVKWLLQTYNGSGKTFIIQNWEGDNDLNLKSVGPDYPEDTASPYSYNSNWDIAVQGMTDWINARQDGVAEGRTAAGSVNNVFAYHAMEVNYNPGAATMPLPENWCVIKAVVPQTRCDLYSWSNWSSKKAGEEWKVIRGLDYYRERLPSVDPQGFGVRRIYMGEFGAYESSFMEQNKTVHSLISDTDYRNVLARQLDFAWRWGVRYMVHWQIYDNGLRSESIPFDANNPYSITESNLVGTWLIRPAPSPDNLRYFTSGYTFTTAHADMLQFNRRYLYEDEQVNMNLNNATPDNFAITTTDQSWCQGDLNRIYRKSNATPRSISYQVTEPMVDFNVKAFISSTGTPSPVGRLKWYSSVNGTSYAGPYEFSTADSYIPDSNAPTWMRFHLGPGFALPAGTKFLRIEFTGTADVTKTQIGNVRIHTLP